jgi:MGT family glycosyltransferase
MLEELQPDCIVSDSMALWGKLLARKLQIPFVSSTTTFAFNRYSAGVVQQSGGELLRMLLSLPAINRQLRRLRRRGYPVQNVLEIIGNDEHTDTVVYTSAEFQPCSETFSEKYAFVGPSMRPAEACVEKQSERMVYISMGTVNNDMLPLYRSCVEALGDLPCQAILSVGGQIEIGALGVLPDHIFVHKRVDQIAVLQQADVFLTHCGMNSVSEALYFGVPLLMLPNTKEQSGVAERVLQLGAGMLLENITSEKIHQSVENLLREPGYRKSAMCIQDSFRRCGGAKVAADKIERCCHS